MDLGPESVAERPAAREVVSAAFGDDARRVLELVDALRSSDHLRASLVARRDGDVVGYVGLSRSWLDTRERLVEVLVVSPLAVRPDEQGRGVGTALLRSAREHAASLGAPVLFLEGDPGYYGPRGYTAGAAHGFSRPSVRIPEPAFQAMLLPLHRPWMHGALIYCEPFWTCDAVGLRDPLLARLEHAWSLDRSP